MIKIGQLEFDVTAKKIQVASTHFDWLKILSKEWIIECFARQMKVCAVLTCIDRVFILIFLFLHELFFI